jgi:hypothetical protein
VRHTKSRIKFDRFFPCGDPHGVTLPIPLHAAAPGPPTSVHTIGFICDRRLSTLLCSNILTRPGMRNMLFDVGDQTLSHSMTPICQCTKQRNTSRKQRRVTIPSHRLFCLRPLT